MSKISLRLPDSLHDGIRILAQRENVSINQLATLAIAEKISALDTEEYLSTRSSRVDRERFVKGLAKIADVDPAEEDSF